MSDRRINRYLAAAGLGSRRSVEELVRAGRISVNDQVVLNLDRRIAEGDRVLLDGRPLNPPLGQRLIALNKPRGYVVSRRPRRGERTVYDLLPPELRRLAHGGRLDRDSRGLVLFSDDGDCLLRSAHPTAGMAKRYLVRVQLPEGMSADRAMSLLRQGVVDQGERLSLDEIKSRGGGDFALELHGGKKRQIRRMFAAIGARTVDLYRESIGPISLGALQLKEGQWCDLPTDAI